MSKSACCTGIPTLALCYCIALLQCGFAVRHCSRTTVHAMHTPSRHKSLSQYTARMLLAGPKLPPYRICNLCCAASREARPLFAARSVVWTCICLKNQTDKEMAVRTMRTAGAGAANRCSFSPFPSSTTLLMRTTRYTAGVLFGCELLLFCTTSITLFISKI